MARKAREVEVKNDSRVQKLVARKSTGGRAPRLRPRRQERTEEHTKERNIDDGRSRINEPESIPSDDDVNHNISTKNELHRLIMAILQDSGNEIYNWEKLIKRLGRSKAKRELSCRDTFGRLPIHFLVSLKLKERFWEDRCKAVRLALEKLPGSECTRDISGYLPLQIACTGDADPKLLRILTKYPTHVLEKIDQEGKERSQIFLEEDRDERNSNTLHIACEHCPRLEVLKVLLPVSNEDIMVKALTQCDGNNNLPIHIAVDAAADLDAIKFLHVEWKKIREERCFEQTNVNGYTPLHFACFPGVDRKTFEYIVTKGKKAIWKPDTDGDLPIHFVSANNKPKTSSTKSATKKDKITILLEAFDDERTKRMLTMPNKKKEMPIHILLNYQKTSIEALNLMLEKAPHLHKEKDGNGNTPLHLALKKRLPHSIICILLEHNQESSEGSTLLTENDRGDIPEDIAKRMQLPGETCQRMVNIIKTHTDKERTKKRKR
mmetsp:Transcript_431/g.996  ORF Transcript_431/g.996 Transcript_431/m.996 type:complete len:492 (+) Transcript_431:266-1741(+)